MKRFLKQILLFSIIVVLALLIIEILIMKNPNEYTFKRDYLRNNGNSIKILIMGHSHAYYGLNPDLIGDSVFNCAIPGKPMYYDLHILRDNISNMQNLKLIVLPIGYDFQCVAAKPNIKSKNRYKSQQVMMFNKYWGIPPEDDSNILKYLYSSEIVWKPQNFLVNYFSPVPIECETNGFHGASSAKDLTGIVDKYDFKNYDSDSIKNIVNRNITYLKEISDICKEHSIKLALIVFPHHHIAREYCTERGLEELEKFVGQVTDDNHVKYFSYIDDDRFVDKDFKDTKHLSATGATKFTKIFTEEILPQLQ